MPSWLETYSSSSFSSNDIINDNINYEKTEVTEIKHTKIATRTSRCENNDVLKKNENEISEVLRRGQRVRLNVKKNTLEKKGEDESEDQKEGREEGGVVLLILDDSARDRKLCILIADATASDPEFILSILR